MEQKIFFLLLPYIFIFPFKQWTTIFSNSLSLFRCVIRYIFSVCFWMSCCWWWWWLFCVCVCYVYLLSDDNRMVRVHHPWRHIRKIRPPQFSILSIFLLLFGLLLNRRPKTIWNEMNVMEILSIQLSPHFTDNSNFFLLPLALCVWISVISWNLLTSRDAYWQIFFWRVCDWRILFIWERFFVSI